MWQSPSLHATTNSFPENVGFANRVARKRII